jgi:hypothetical protein
MANEDPNGGAAIKGGAGDGDDKNQEIPRGPDFTGGGDLWAERQNPVQTEPLPAKNLKQAGS